LVRSDLHTCVYIIVIFDDIERLFFFSSRRRHTRSKRDWSSDVCSSDLVQWQQTFALSAHLNHIKEKVFVTKANMYVVKKVRLLSNRLLRLKGEIGRAHV